MDKNYRNLSYLTRPRSLRAPNRRALAAAALTVALGIATAARAADAPAAGGGLDSLDHKQLLSELAADGLNSLFDRQATLDQLTPDQRRVYTGAIAWRQLGQLYDQWVGPEHKAPTDAQVDPLLKQAVASLDGVLAGDDTAALSTDAQAMLKLGVEPNQNLLEEWGEDSVVQKTLQPMADAVSKLLQRIVDVATAQGNAKFAILSQQQHPDPKLRQECEDLDKLAQSATYAKAQVADFAIVLSIDGSTPDGQAQRAQVAKGAITYLSQFDSPDSGFQPAIRVMLGKFLAATGEYDKAQRDFSSVIAPDSNDPLTPLPNFSQQYQARFWSIVCNIQAGKFDDAKKQIDDLQVWQDQNIKSLLANPSDDAMLKSEKAYLGRRIGLLRYRLPLKESETAPTPADKAAHSAQASAALAALGQAYPELKNLIRKQVIDHLSSNIDVSSQDALTLQTIMEHAKGLPDGAPADEAKATIDRGIKAATTLLSRPTTGPNAISADLLREASLALPQLQQRAGDIAGAVAGYTHYASKYAAEFSATNPNPKVSVDRAVGLAYKLHVQSPKDPKVNQLFIGAMKVAIGEPYKELECAFPLANALAAQPNHDTKEVVDYYLMVPKSEPDYASARLSALNTLYDEIQKGQAPPATLDALRKQAGALAEELVALPLGDNPKPEQRTRAAYARVIAASLDNDKKDYAGAIKLLDGVEALVKDVKNAEWLESQAAFLRADALIGAGRFDDATKEVVALANRPGSGGGVSAAANLVAELLRKIDTSADEATARGDAAAVKGLAASRAKLSGFMVKIATDSKKPELIRTATIYDAQSQLMAGMLLEGRQRADALESALARYQELEKQVVKAEGEDGADVGQARFGIGLAAYGLGQWKLAGDTLGGLLAQGKLGSEFIRSVDPATGIAKTTENAYYWEGYYKMLDADLQRAKADPRDADAKSTLEAAKEAFKNLIIRDGENVGGSKWKAKFADLRTQMLGDWAPANAAPATQPST